MAPSTRGKLLHRHHLNLGIGDQIEKPRGRPPAEAVVAGSGLP